MLILHVLEPAYAHGHTLGYVPEVLQIMEEEGENGKDLLARASKQLCEKGFKVTTALEIGNPKVLIVDLAAEWHADLIVGSHGLKGLNVSCSGACPKLLHVTRIVQCRSCGRFPGPDKSDYRNVGYFLNAKNSAV